VREFGVLLKTLSVGNIPTWVSYEQFVARGLQPSFDEIADTGRRLRSLRTRLGSVTEMLETSALVGQSAATRHNTAVLRNATAILMSILAVVLLRFSFPRLWGTVTTWALRQLEEADVLVAALADRLLVTLGPWVILGALGLVAAVGWLFRL
jgi:hypothetical protein